MTCKLHKKHKHGKNTQVDMMQHDIQ